MRGLSGQADFFQWQGIGEDIGGRRAQAAVTTLSIVGVIVGLAGAVLLAAVIGE